MFDLACGSNTKAFLGPFVGLLLRHD
jgi:hypothetical protein